jgi:2-phospho-L-lactate guanylyltransferase
MTSQEASASPVTGWALVVPVKRLSVAKTRLTRVAGEQRAALALAFAADTVAAALSSPSVGALLVVTDDPAAADLAASLGAEVIADLPDAGINAALSHGARQAAARWPELGVGALASDLPALRGTELTRALAAAAEHAAAFVCDAEGIGTTLLTARQVEDFGPRFGRRSRAAHRVAGVVELTLAGIPTVRRDVDTEVGLYDARRLGLGPRSAAIAAGLLEPAGPGSR